MFIRYLPKDSAIARALGGADAAWLLEHHLLASIFDRINTLGWQYQAAHTEKGKPAPERPKPLPRPGVTDPGAGRLGNTDGLDMAQVQAYLDSMAPPREEAVDGE